MATSMPPVFTENQIVEEPAIGSFAEVGWQTRSLLALIEGRRPGGAEEPEEQIHNLR